MMCKCSKKKEFFGILPAILRQKDRIYMLNDANRILPFKRDNEGRKMKKNYNTLTIKSLIAVLLMISIGTSMILSSTVNGQTLAPGKVAADTWAYVIANPNPIGVGQTANLGFFIDKAPPTALYYYGDRWKNMTVLETKPDGTTETLGPFTSDATGGTFASFTPTQIGNYSFVLTFPGQYITGENPSPIVGTNSPASVGNYYRR